MSVTERTVGTKSMDAMLAEVETLVSRRANDPGFTVSEMTQRLGCGTDRARDLLRAAKSAGRLALGRRTSETLDGRKVTIPVYRILPKPKK